MKISIITVTYNSAATIGDTIESVLKQSYPDLEYIVIDGVSKDHTMEIVNSYLPKFKGRMKCISEPDKGIYDAMNKGLNLATGDIIGILNSDDLYTDNKVIEKIISLFEMTSVDCVYADLYYVNKENTNQIVRHWVTNEYIPGAFKKGWHPAHPTLFVRKEIYRKYGLFNLDFSLAADFELMLRLFERYNITSAYLPEPIVRMRLGGATSKNIQNIIKQNIECYKAFKTNKIKVSVLYPFYRVLPKLKQFFHE